MYDIGPVAPRKRDDALDPPQPASVHTHDHRRDTELFESRQPLCSRRIEGGHRYPSSEVPLKDIGPDDELLLSSSKTGLMVQNRYSRSLSRCGQCPPNR